MSSLRVLVFVLVLAQLGVLVESGSSGKISRMLRVRGSELWDLYQRKIYLAEWMVRPLDGLCCVTGDISHSGVRVTLMNGDQWLIHKGPNFGVDTDTVVVDADYMSSKWRRLRRKYFFGRKTVRDFVRAGGKTYNLVNANCHHAAKAMMTL